MTDAQRAFLAEVLIVVVVAGAALAIWALRYVILLLFNAVLVALFLQALYAPLMRRGLGRRLGLALVVVALVIIIGLAGGFFGLRIEQQVSEALQLMPQAVAGIETSLRGNPIGARFVSGLSELNIEAALPALLHLPGYALTATEVVADALVVVVGGLFIAARPDGYRTQLLALAPGAVRAQLDGFLDEVGPMLRKWLIAQFIAMVTVGILIGSGLWLIGVPAAGAVGLFAAGAEFIPIAGPIASAIPALLLASAHGAAKVGWTLALVVVVQQFESNLLIPLLNRRIVRLAPLLVVFALLAFEVLFGFLGLLLAAPLTIVLKAAVERRLAGGWRAR